MLIQVNGKTHRVVGETISYAEVAALADVPMGTPVLYETIDQGAKALKRGTVMKLEPELRFTAQETCDA